MADKVVDPGTKRPYSVSMIEKAMQEVHFNVRAERSAKSQVSRRDFSRETVVGETQGSRSKGDGD